jgi:Copper type II ascorbate-dependent monooxygenase, C-terminal domain
MRTRFVSFSPLLLSLLLAGACGGDDDATDAADDGADGADDDGADDGLDAGGGGSDAGSIEGYEPILTTTWSLPPPTSSTPDQYFCARKTMDEDVFVSGFRTISPNGTHHTVLSVGEPQGPDTPSEECGAASNHDALLYASGVGTDDFDFPEGVGVRVAAGQQLVLNVHTFNATDNDLTGTSGVAVKIVPAVETEAEFTFVGPINFSIPGEPVGEPVEITGACPMSQDVTVLNWWPHMHQLGTHMKIEVDGAIVHDEPFSFDEQVNYPTDRELSAGAEVRVTCTYVNETGEDVPFGDSSNREMCFAGFYRYPKLDQDFCLSF